MNDRVRRLVAPVARPVMRRWRAGGSLGRRPPRKPPGWITGPPDFVGVGAQRGGTTWWFGLLCDHPRIQRSGKELHFFDRYFDREFSDADVGAYHRLFPRPKEYLIGEWSPRYMHDFWTPAMLRMAAPSARILVLLRDPMGRYQSGISHEVAEFMRAVPRRRRQYAGAMTANDALSRSLYARQLQRLLEHFDRRQVLVLQYERCVQDSAGELRRTYEFLGADPVDHVPALLKDRAGRGHPQLHPTDAVAEAARQVILQDVSQVKALIPEIDLDLWPSCRDFDARS
jgi:sulfotransferase family protein